MPDVTVVSKPYGYRCHTGTTIATVSNGKLRVKGITCWGNQNDTAVFTDKDGSVFAKFTIATTAKAEYLPLWGAPIDGLSVTHSASTIESRVIIK
jgi:hypothetical protein